jgi:Zn(2)-Cys(6) binuclear cluster domain-containing protein
MPQTKTSLERDNPPPRRKSCLACTRARRRCDQATPACQRCAQRTIDCQYPQGARPRRTPVHVPASSSSSTPSISVNQVSASSLFDLPTTPHASFDMLGPSDDLFEGLDSNFMDLEAVPSLEPRRELDVINPSPPTTATLALVPSRLTTDAQRTRALTSRLQYGVDQVIAAPRMMVFENHMPWCHAQLYDDGMPRSMQGELTVFYIHLAADRLSRRRLLRCPSCR